jgi:hypothetical protein
VIISRKDAKASGLKKFRVGLPCAKGHHAERWVRNNLCVVCHPVLKKRQKRPKWKRQEGWTRCKRERRAIDPAYKLLESLRSRMVALLKGKSKSARTKVLLGCDPAWFIANVAPALLAAASTRYGLDLTLENHGKVWHWDHHQPLASFDHSKPVHQRVAWCWTNLRPLPVSVNLKKSCKLPGDRKVPISGFAH